MSSAKPSVLSVSLADSFSNFAFDLLSMFASGNGKLGFQKVLKNRFKIGVKFEPKELNLLANIVLCWRQVVALRPACA